MATGALYNGKCYDTNAQAADAYFLGSVPAFSSGSTSYVSWYEKVSGVWQIKRQSIASNGTITTLTASTATVPTFPTCDTVQNFTDGVTVGWGIATVMVTAWCLAQVRKQAR